MKQLAPDTVALFIASAKTTQAQRPFGCCGLWFTREPSVIMVSEVGKKKATLLLNERALDVEEHIAAPEIAIDMPPELVEVTADHPLGVPASVAGAILEVAPEFEHLIEVKPLAPELPDPVITFEVDSTPEPEPEPTPEAEPEPPPPPPKPTAKPKAAKPKAKPRKKPAKAKPRKRRGA